MRELPSAIWRAILEQKPYQMKISDADVSILKPHYGRSSGISSIRFSLSAGRVLSDSSCLRTSGVLRKYFSAICAV
jgi:hypothetical protein